MPELSRFHGIVITMYSEPGGRHHYPHFHARYAGHKAIYRVWPVERIAGFLPNPQEALVLLWAEKYRRALRRNWVILQQGKNPFPIEPVP